MAETIEDVIPRCFLTHFTEDYCAARIISQDERKEYDSVLYYNDRDGEGKLVLQGACNCGDWRGYRPGSEPPGQYFCKHLGAQLVVWMQAVRPPLGSSHG